MGWLDGWMSGWVDGGWWMVDGGWVDERTPDAFGKDILDRDLEYLRYLGTTVVVLIELLINSSLGAIGCIYLVFSQLSLLFLFSAEPRNIMYAFAPRQSNLSSKQ